jgi:hypothetical protein
MRRSPLNRPLPRALAALFAVPALTACGDDAQTAPATPDTAEDTAAEDTVATPDAAPEDVAPPPPEGPNARVFPVDPLTSPEAVVVGLTGLSDPPTHLQGQFARVRSCTPDIDRGPRSTMELQNGDRIDFVSCVPESRALALDGDYLHIPLDLEDPAAPPGATTDDGRLAEVMMYHHMTAIHHFYSDFYGIKDRDEDLDAITNIQTWVSACDAWTQWSNAAYVPREALDYLMTGLSLTDTQGDAIVFSGAGARNFAHDATVIYHEYTHAILGATRLSGVFLDDQGINNLPGALNEAYADYFAGTMTEEAEVGQYALNDLVPSDFCGLASEEDAAENYARDMRSTRTCPDDLVGEVHVDSQIFSAALWEMREALGKLAADSIALYAVLQLTEESDFDVAANATIEAARDIYGDATAEQVKGFFASRNLLACERVVPAERLSGAPVPPRHEGTRIFGDMNPYPGYVPGYMQYALEAPAGAKKATITLSAVGNWGGGVTLDVAGAFKRGGAVRYTLGQLAGQARNDAEFVIEGNGRTIVLARPDGSELGAGTWSLSLHNQSRRGFRLIGLAVAWE